MDEHDKLLTMVKKRKRIRWFGHISKVLCLSKDDSTGYSGKKKMKRYTEEAVEDNIN